MVKIEEEKVRENRRGWENGREGGRFTTYLNRKRFIYI